MLHGFVHGIESDLRVFQIIPSLFKQLKKTLLQRKVPFQSVEAMKNHRPWPVSGVSELSEFPGVDPWVMAHEPPGTP